MNGTEEYLETVRAYSDGVRVLLAPAGIAAGDRGRAGPTSYADLAGQAEVLLPVSAQVNQAAAARLAAAPAQARADAEIALLAKALTDLEIGAYLQQAARQEEAKSEWYAPAADDRSRASAQFAEPYLELLLGEGAALEAEERGPGQPHDVAAARGALLASSGSALLLISQRATSTSETALQRLLAIGLGELANAVAAVGMGVAEALGAAETVSELYKLVRGFVDRAMDALLALLGPELAKIAAEEAKKWAEKLDLGEPIGILMEKLYQTQQTKSELQPVIESAPAALNAFVSAIGRVDGLNEKYRRQTELVGTILDKARWLAAIPATVVPNVPLLLAVLYLVLAGYVIFLGADYVDAPPVGWLDRVPGVRRVIEADLVPA
jgi:hypothetical protein